MQNYRWGISPKNSKRNSRPHRLCKSKVKWIKGL
jgi:hypothetical protein